MVVAANVRDLNARPMIGRIETLLGDLAIGKEHLAVGDAAHLQALQAQRLESLAENEFCAATTDIYHQSRVLVVGERVGDAEIDEACLLSTVDDIDRRTEDLLRGCDKVLPIFCASQRVGADNTKFGGRGAVDQLLESL